MLGETLRKNQATVWQTSMKHDGASGGVATMDGTGWWNEE